jgi:hypothetical protein
LANFRKRVGLARSAMAMAMSSSQLPSSRYGAGAMPRALTVSHVCMTKTLFHFLP